MNVIAGARISGKRGDAIVFVHGVGSTAAIWDQQLAAFAPRYRCFAVELRGNGASKPDPPAETISREGFAQDVLTVADAAGVDRFHFVGCSLGGVVALELLGSHAGRFLSVTFVGSFAAYENGAAYAQTVSASVREARSMAAFARARAAKLGLPPGRRTDESIEQMACKSVECYLASTNATWTGDYRHVLPRIDVPALVVYGENDTVAPASYAQELAANIRGARVDRIADAGHVANADAPDRFNAILAEFLDQAA